MSKRADEICLPSSILNDSAFSSFRTIKDIEQANYREESRRFLKRITSKNRRKRKEK